MKKVMWSISLAGVCAALWLLFNWSLFYGCLKQLSADGTLPFFTAIVGTLVTIAGIIVSYILYKGGEWKVKMKASLVVYSKDSYKNTKAISNSPFITFENVGMNCFAYIFHQLIIRNILYSSDAVDINQLFYSDEEWQVLEENLLEIIKVEIRNTGRLELRFQIPTILGASINPMEIQLNGIKLNTQNNEFYSLASGEVMSFYYPYSSISKNTKVIEIVPHWLSSLTKLPYISSLHMSIQDNRGERIKLKGLHTKRFDERLVKFKLYSDVLALTSTSEETFKSKKELNDLTQKVCASIVKTSNDYDMKTMHEVSNMIAEYLIATKYENIKSSTDEVIQKDAEKDFKRYIRQSQTRTNVDLKSFSKIGFYQQLLADI